MAVPSDFGLFLKQKRTEAKLTQWDLASAIGKTGQYISNIENGKNSAPPDPADIEALIGRLGLAREDARRFRVRAAADRRRLPPGQTDYLLRHERLLELIDFGMRSDIDDGCWEKILRDISGGRQNDAQ